MLYFYMNDTHIYQILLKIFCIFYMHALPYMNLNLDIFDLCIINKTPVSKYLMFDNNKYTIGYKNQNYPFDYNFHFG
jgi:hypothetical protein